MVDLKQLLTDITASIVDKPEEIAVTETSDDYEIVLSLHVAESDMGKVIGKRGRIAKAIRMVMKAAANSVDKRVNVDILEPDETPGESGSRE